MADLQLYLEAERRGLLPADKQSLLDEARSRGLIEGSAKPAPKIESEIPQRKYSLPEAISTGVTKIPEGYANLISGIKEVVTNPSILIKPVMGMEANAAESINAPPVVTNAIKSVMSTGQLFGPIKQLYDRLNPSAEKENKAMADSVTKDVERKYGTYDNFKRAIAEDPVAVALDLSTVFTGGASAFAKAPAVASKLTTAAKYTNPMTPIVGAGKVANYLTATPASKIRNALTPTTTTLSTVTEGRSPALQAKLNEPTPDIVPGSKPTVAELTSDVSGTLLPAFQKQIFEKNPTAPTERAAERDAARIAQVQKISKTENVITALKELRDTNAKENFGAAYDESVIADPTLTALMNRPSMNKVFAKAKELAAEKNDTFQSGINVPAKETTVKNPLTLGMIKETTPAKFAEYPVKSLHYVIKAFDDLLDPNLSTGFKGNKAFAIRDTRREFVKWMEGKSEAYKLAREKYGEQSTPITKAEVGNLLEAKLKDTLDENRLKDSAREFTKTIAADQIPKSGMSKTTGAARFNSLTELYSPEEMKILQSISDDVNRQVKTKRLAAEGAKAGSQIATIDSAPALLSKVATVTNYIIDRLSGRLNEKMAAELALEMLNDPAAFSARLDKVISREKNAASFAKAKSVAGTALKSLPARTAVQVNNALANQENRNALAQ